MDARAFFISNVSHSTKSEQWLQLFGNDQGKKKKTHIFALVNLRHFMKCCKMIFRSFCDVIIKLWKQHNAHILGNITHKIERELHSDLKLKVVSSKFELLTFWIDSKHAKSQTKKQLLSLESRMISAAVRFSSSSLLSSSLVHWLSKGQIHLVHTVFSTLSSSNNQLVSCN